MFLNNSKQQAEVYFFKPHKKKTAHKKDFYAVIALDFPSIRHIDIHVHQIEKGIDLLIEVEDEQIQKAFAQHAEALLEKIASKGYQLTKYNCRVKTQKEVWIEKEILEPHMEGVNITI